MFTLEVNSQTYQFRASAKAAQRVANQEWDYVANPSGVLYGLRRGNPLLVQSLLQAMSPQAFDEDFFEMLDNLGDVAAMLEAEILSSFQPPQREALGNLVTQFAISVNTRELELAQKIATLPTGGPSSLSVSENLEQPTPESGLSENSARCATPDAEPTGSDSAT